MNAGYIIRRPRECALSAVHIGAFCAHARSSAKHTHTIEKKTAPTSPTLSAYMHKCDERQLFLSRLNWNGATARVCAEKIDSDRVQSGRDPVTWSKRVNWARANDEQKLLLKNDGLLLMHGIATKEIGR